jgi:hypothetical protein
MHLPKVNKTDLLANCILLTTIVLAGLIYVGCDNQPGEPKKLSSEAQEVNAIQYVKDKRTGLCFAVSYVHGYPIGTDNVYTHVPCRDEVEKLIK